MSFQSTLSIAKKTLRLDDEVRFIRSWMEKPLATGAVMPSGKPLAGAVTAALVEQGIDPSRLVLVEFNPTFCRLLRTRYPDATVVQGDAYGIKRLLASLLRQPAAAVVSGLPLFTKPLKFRLRLLTDAFTLLIPGAPFVQFTYAVVPPIPRAYSGARAHCSERIWLNVPPARVWVYRKT
jgi:phosphatidylethanolamine/phosphatidyl-N-methylethanolamine N-methyltransferase